MSPVPSSPRWPQSLRMTRQLLRQTSNRGPCCRMKSKSQVRSSSMKLAPRLQKEHLGTQPSAGLASASETVALARVSMASKCARTLSIRPLEELRTKLKASLFLRSSPLLRRRRPSKKRRRRLLNTRMQAWSSHLTLSQRRRTRSATQNQSLCQRSSQ